MTLRDIVDATKLSLRTLTDLENNRLDRLPGGIYRRAIIRSYAAEVGLDPEATLRAFLKRHPDDVPSTAPIVPASEPSPSSRTLRAVISLLGALIPVLAGVFYFTSSAGGSAPPPPIIEVMAPRGYDTWPADVVPASTIDPSDTAAMKISVSADTMLQVVADGEEVVARRVAAGEVFQLDLARDVVLVGDDAGAVRFSINGLAGRLLGGDGTPLRAHIPRHDYLAWVQRP